MARPTKPEKEIKKQKTIRISDDDLKFLTKKRKYASIQQFINHHIMVEKEKQDDEINHRY